MAAPYVVQPGQSLQDCALMMAGTLEALDAIAAANGLSVSDDVVAGQVLSFPAAYEGDAGVLKVVGRDGILFGTLGPVEVTEG